MLKKCVRSANTQWAGMFVECYRIARHPQNLHPSYDMLGKAFNLSPFVNISLINMEVTFT